MNCFANSCHSYSSWANVPIFRFSLEYLIFSQMCKHLLESCGTCFFSSTKYFLNLDNKKYIIVHSHWWREEKILLFKLWLFELWLIPMLYRSNPIKYFNKYSQMGKKWIVRVFSSNTEFCIILFFRAHTLACSVFILWRHSTFPTEGPGACFFSNFYIFLFHLLIPSPLKTKLNSTYSMFFIELF